MPWDVPLKQVVRDNSRYTGDDVWDQDAVAGELVDSTGHDYHDEDLAQAISDCLNLDGINEMRADLDVGGFKLKNCEVVPDTLAVNGEVRHKLNDQGAGTAAIDVSASHRHVVDNDGALTMTFSGLPSGSDATLGNTYAVEGTVVIHNGASPGTITLAGLPAGYKEIGAQSTDASIDQVLTYVIHRRTGTNSATLVWSAVSA